MLQVKTHIKESTIPNAGFGLFASQFIPKDSLIWIFNPIVDKVIKVNSLQYLNDIEMKVIKVYAYKQGDEMILCSDNGRYINHSETPNTLDYIDPILGSVTIAKFDIQENEEIFSDYNSFDDEHNEY